MGTNALLLAKAANAAPSVTISSSITAIHLAGAATIALRISGWSVGLITAISLNVITVRR
jgi:hypothetical protein